ncbi:unnamed protein product [Brassicogethes aeneus]|uniref:Fork-head domain-containing protein n=1 Tax=Brassicogethes aeneus TaxID=1431903 RepID=A0A9P0B9Y5_BRAAE|nr:unnamed protein product [Brassicogethes aeneus]
MNHRNIVYRNNADHRCIKVDSINYCKISGAKRVVSQTFLQPTGSSTNKIGKILRNVTNSLPEIAIKREDDDRAADSRLLLVNGCWDTSNKIPNIIADLHNVSSDEFQSMQNISFKEHDFMTDSKEFTNRSPRDSDSGIESDCTDGNLSWLLNYKIHELPPVPDTLSSDQLIENRILTSGYQENKEQRHRIVEIRNSCFKEDATKSTGSNSSYSGLKKPPFTYTELIEHALNEKGELTVSGIYQWISDHFPFYKQHDDRWKNSVRHNLSINPHFRKGGKAVHGAGHLWTIAQRDEKRAKQIKLRMQQFIQTAYKDLKTEEQHALDEELKAATESILVDGYNERRQENVTQTRVANGLEKESIEVEFVNIIDVPTGLEDFLSPPVSKQQIVQECGLGSDFFITDLNPNALGLNLSEAIAEDGIYEDMSFEYYENT